jgi:hypothetical protein
VDEVCVDLRVGPRAGHQLACVAGAGQRHPISHGVPRGPASKDFWVPPRGHFPKGGLGPWEDSRCCSSAFNALREDRSLQSL